MKLNNKGFAFSTMLYGTLSLIILILLVILNISKNASDEMYFYSSVIEKDLNNCVYEEIALENCFASGNTNCDATSYHACLGISDYQEETNGEIISTTLKKLVVDSGTGLYSDENISNRYVYKGTEPNNYIKYSGMLWRIVSVEADGTIKICNPDYATKYEWDKDASDEWQGSSLKSKLNNEFYSTLQDTSKIVNFKWNAARIYPSAGEFTIGEFLKQQEERREDTSSLGYVGLLSLADYANAAIDNENKCRLSILTSDYCGSWLTKYKSWLINVNGEKTTSQAYYFSNDNKLYLTSTSTNYNVIPVIVLNRNNVISGGEGTFSNPFLLK